MSKFVYTFGNGSAEGRADMKELLGCKGANLAEMNLFGILVPPGEPTTELTSILLDAALKAFEESVSHAGFSTHYAESVPYEYESQKTDGGRRRGNRLKEIHYSSSYVEFPTSELVQEFASQMILGTYAQSAEQASVAVWSFIDVEVGRLPYSAQEQRILETDEFVSVSTTYSEVYRAEIRNHLCFFENSITGGRACEPAHGNLVREKVGGDSRHVVTRSESPLSGQRGNHNGLEKTDGISKPNRRHRRAIGPKIPKKVMVCYSHLDDQKLLLHVFQQLRILSEHALVTFYYDGMVPEGIPYEEELLNQMKQADIIILLISPNFMDSESCRREMALALRLKRVCGTQVIPVILEPTFGWQNLEIGQLKALPPDGKPISSYEHVFVAMMEFARGLERAIRAGGAAVAGPEKVIARTLSGERRGRYDITVSGDVQMEQLLGALRAYAADASLTLVSIKEVE